METASRADKRRYSAFVSYSHADRGIGARLFRWLDAYRPPKALIGRQTPFGPVPRTLHPCFRDREELSAARDVASSLDDALKASEHLVIVCSPAAAKSEWVAHEIKTFVALRGADRVHTVLVSGEPEAAFPPALKAAGIASPLAADLRPRGDGWTDGAMKLAAGVLGVPFGELKDRERARARARTRVAVGITSAFAALFVSACGASWVALDRIDAAQDMFVSMLRQVSAPLDRLVEEQGKSLITSEAEREIAVARALTETAFAVAPDNPKLAAEEARLSLVYARYYLVIGKSADALEKAKRSVQLYENLNSSGAKEPARLKMWASALRTEGNIFKTLGSYRKAEERLKQGVSILNSLQKPLASEAAEELALTLNSLADLADRNKDFVRAAELHAYLLELAEGEADPDVRRQFVVAQEGRGDLLVARGDYRGARAVFSLALSQARQLAAAEPQDRRMRRDIAVCLERLASVALAVGETAEGRLKIDEALQVLGALAESDPDDKLLQSDLLVGRWWSMRIAAAESGQRISRDEFGGALSMAESLARIDPDNVVWNAARARSMAELLYFERTGQALDILAYDAPQVVLAELSRAGIEIPPRVRDEIRVRLIPRLPQATAPGMPPPN